MNEVAQSAGGVSTQMVITAILGCLFLISELIGKSNAKSNGVFQLIANILKAILGKKK